MRHHASCQPGVAAATSLSSVARVHASCRFLLGLELSSEVAVPAADSSGFAVRGLAHSWVSTFLSSGRRVYCHIPFPGRRFSHFGVLLFCHFYRHCRETTDPYAWIFLLPWNIGKRMWTRDGLKISEVRRLGGFRPLQCTAGRTMKKAMSQWSAFCWNDPSSEGFRASQRSEDHERKAVNLSCQMFY